MEKIVISASRRTDVPAFYMDWFMERIRDGVFLVKNPYNNRTRVVPATVDRVHTIVFWSKDFHRFLRGGYGEDLKGRGYNLFFNFTVNSESKILEPGIPPLGDRLGQLEMLAERFGGDCVTWRFDPAVFYSLAGEEVRRNNLGQFEIIARKAASLKISRCVTSFFDFYPKIQKRVAKKRPDLTFEEPGMEEKAALILRMEGVLQRHGIGLFTCCEKLVADMLPGESGVRGSSCIPSDLLARLFGGRLSLKRDAGQRMKQGCGCMVSADIGSYNLQPCFHDCLYCYANPSAG